MAVMDAAVAAAKSRRTIDGISHRYVANPWLSFTEWLQHLAGFQRDELLATIRPKPEGNEVRIRRTPDRSEGESDGEDDEEELEQTCQATRRLIRRAFAVCKPSIVGRPALEYVNR